MKQKPIVTKKTDDVFNPGTPDRKALIDDVFGDDMTGDDGPSDDGSLTNALEREMLGDKGEAKPAKKDEPKPDERKPKDEPKPDNDVDLFATDEDDDEPSKDDAKDDEEDEDDGVEFRKLPGQDEEEQKPEDFNEEEFDKATELEVKALDPKQAKAWRKLKADLKEAKKAAVTGSQASKELAEAKKAAAELEQVRLERDGLKERLTRATAASTRAMVEASDDYVNGVEKPVAAAAELVDRIAEDNKADGEALWAAVTDQNPERRQRKLAELWKGMPDEARADILGASREYAIALAKRQELLKNGDELVKKNEAQKLAMESEKQRKQADEVRVNMKPLLDSYIKLVPGALDEDGDETDTARVIRRRAMSADVSQLDPTDLAYAVVAATMLPEMRNAMREMRKELARLRGKRTPAVKTSDGIPTKQKAVQREPQGLMSALRDFPG